MATKKENIEALYVNELYYYTLLCEKIIDKLVNDINCEKLASFSLGDYVETDTEKEFKKFSKIHDALINEGKKKLLDLEWEK